MRVCKPGAGGAKNLPDMKLVMKLGAVVMLVIEGDGQASTFSIIDVNDICRGWKCLTFQISAVQKPKLQFQLQLLCSLLNPLTLLLLSL